MARKKQRRSTAPDEISEEVKWYPSWGWVVAGMVSSGLLWLLCSATLAAWLQERFETASPEELQAHLLFFLGLRLLGFVGGLGPPFLTGLLLGLLRGTRGSKDILLSALLYSLIFVGIRSGSPEVVESFRSLEAFGVSGQTALVVAMSLVALFELAATFAGGKLGIRLHPFTRPSDRSPTRRGPEDGASS